MMDNCVVFFIELRMGSLYESSTRIGTHVFKPSRACTKAVVSTASNPTTDNTTHRNNNPPTHPSTYAHTHPPTHPTYFLPTKALCKTHTNPPICATATRSNNNQNNPIRSHQTRLLSTKHGFRVSVKLPTFRRRRSATYRVMFVGIALTVCAG